MNFLNCTGPLEILWSKGLNRGASLMGGHFNGDHFYGDQLNCVEMLEVTAFVNQY